MYVRATVVQGCFPKPDKNHKEASGTNGTWRLYWGLMVEHRGDSTKMMVLGWLSHICLLRLSAMSCLSLTLSQWLHVLGGLLLYIHLYLAHKGGRRHYPLLLPRKEFRISHCTHAVIAARSLKSLEVSQWLEHGYRTQPITILYIVGENSKWRSGPFYSVSLSFSTHYIGQAS